VTLSYFLKRLTLVFYTMLVVSVIVFAVTQILPADAAVTMLGENATPQALAALRARMGLNEPAYIQYLNWLVGIFQGNFGTSLRTSQAVGQMVFEALWRSLELAFFSIVLMLIVAIPSGIVAAVHRGKPLDVGVSVFSYIGASLPEFVTATLAGLFIADWLGWLPPAGYVPITQDLFDNLRHLVLPVCVISFILTAHVVRMMRSELVDVLHTDYIRAARLKGLSNRVVLLRHALRNALLPVITVIALDVGYLLGGIIVVEEIFAIPGLGRTLVVAIQTRDIPTIQAAVLIMAAVYTLVNFMADMLYTLLDKRIRYA